MSDPCLVCVLPDCNDSDPSCPVGNVRRAGERAVNKLRRANPAFRAQEYRGKKKWRHTPNGRVSQAAAQRRYVAKHKETMAAINARYYAANKAAILAKKAAAYQARKAGA